MSKPVWSIKGNHFANCNCDFGCPCQFNALPTDNTCKAIVAWDIEEGNFGDVDLSGLKVATLYSWENPIHEGNGQMQVIIEEKANKEQRKALVDVMNGENTDPGKIMIQIYRSMCTQVHEPIFAPIKMNIDVEGRTANIIVDGIVETTLEPIKNPVTGAEHRARFDLPNGKEFNSAEVASGTTKIKAAFPLEFTSSHAHLSADSMTSEGPNK
jgi:hypothetical protein